MSPSDLDSAVNRTLAALCDRACRLEGVPVRPLPGLAQVATLADEARHILFPEVRIALECDSSPVARLQCLRDFARKVREAIGLERHALCPHPAPDAADCPSCDTESTRVAARLLDALPGVRLLLEGDIEAALDGDPAANSSAEVVLCYPGFLAIATHRIAHVLYESGARLVPRLMSEQAHARTGIELHPGATIGPRFFIDHGTGVVVGETAVIGERVRLYQGVTLGARSLPRSEARKLNGQKRHPTLEDDVIVYANATILGGDTVIGRGAIVGGNCWVTTSVPAAARVSLDVAPRAAEAVVAVRREG